ncbi:hypothetical protein BASA81_011110 [Batrachochytrium salamandrivorans]|nr:hypothetical protein BASA81_011110 [Batrachochytrium salamandrivorans]
MVKSVKFVVGFNILLFIVGCVVFGMSIAMKQTFQDAGWGVLISTGAIGLGIFIGLFMILTSVLGCYAARKNRKRTLCCYLILVCFLLILQIAASAALIGYGNRFSTVFSVPSSTLASSDDQFLNNALLSVFSKCCSGCDNVKVSEYTSGVVTTCNMLSAPGDDFVAKNNGWTGNLCNTTLQQGAYPSQPTITCEVPSPCTSTNTDNCWVYAQGTHPSTNAYPPFYVDNAFCTLLSGVQVLGSPVVGYPQIHGCGRGTVREFVSSMTSYFVPKMNSGGIVFAFIAVLMCAALLAGLYIVMCVTRDIGEGDVEELGDKGSLSLA